MKKRRYRRGPDEAIWIPYEGKRPYRVPLKRICLCDADVAAIRKRVNLSQERFAHRFGFPVATLRHWEQGVRKPRGPALALLHIIDYHPAVAMAAILRARQRNNVP